MSPQQPPTTASWAVDVPVGYQVGPWRVTSGIASGSWGSVYAAVRTGEDRSGSPCDVALKFLPTGTVTSRQLVHLQEMVRRETHLRQRIEHPRVIRTFDAITVDDPGNAALDGAVVLVMERAVGSLGDLLKRSDGAPVPEAGRYIEQICEGLAYLHAAGWIHGDLKPANVLISPDGSIRLADFGLSAEVDGTHGYIPPTCTPDFAPPERWTEPLGERGTAIRTTADIWALGVTAHQLLTGRLPFPGATPSARAAAAAAYVAGRAELQLASWLPDGWRAFIEDCLAPDHTGRQAHDAASLLVRIREINRVAQPPRRRAGVMSKHRWIALAAAFVLGAATAITTVLVMAEGGAAQKTRATFANRPEPSHGDNSPTVTPAPTPSGSASAGAPVVRPGTVRISPVPGSPVVPRGSTPPTTDGPPKLPVPDGNCTNSGNPPVVSDHYKRGPFQTVWCTTTRRGTVVWDPFGIVGDRNAPAGVVEQGTKAVVCQKHNPTYGWYVYLKSDIVTWPDTGGWGWYPATLISGGAGGDPVAGLPTCDITAP